MQKKEYNRAILEFKNAAQAMPKDAEIYNQLGMAYSLAQDFRSALAAFRKALALNPKHVEAQLRIAQLMAATGDPGLVNDAEGRLKALLDTSSSTPEMLNTLAFTELRLGRGQDAVETLEKALKQSPGSLSSAIILAITKLAHHDVKGAEEVLKKASDSAGNSADSHLVLGQFYAAEKKIPEAEAEFRRALASDSKSGPAVMQLATLLNDQGRKQEAEQDFKQLAGMGKAYAAAYGLFLFQEGRQAEGIREFERVAKESPDDRQARTRLVAAYQAANRQADAEKTLSQALKANPKDLDALLQQSEFLVKMGKFEQAEAGLNQVLQLKPDAAELHYVLAKLQEARGSAFSYRQELTKALQLNPLLLPVRLELAQTLVSTNHAQAALALLNETPDAQKQLTSVLVQRNWVYWAMDNLAEMRKGVDLGLSQQKSEELLVQDGLLKQRSGNFAGARAALEQALELNPADLRALDALKSSYVAQKQTPLAIQKVKEYAARQPKSAVLQEFLGTLLLRNGDRDQARAAFNAAKAADPKFQQADFSLVQVDVVEKKWDDARNRLKGILAGKENPVAHLWLANVEEMKGNHAGALEEFRKTVETDPNNVVALNSLAYLLSDFSNKPDEALKYAQKAQELAPDVPVIEDTLGWILYTKGIYDGALKHLERGVKQGDCAVCQYHLAMAYAKSGDVERGRATLKTAMRMDPSVPEAKTAQEVVAGTK